MSKKSIYATPEQEKKDLLKEMSDLSIKHGELCDDLREKSNKISLLEIKSFKKRIDEVRKQRDVKNKAYLKLCQLTMEY
jgi:hypothetical protein